MRKIIQITSCATEGNLSLVVLCDDGTVWQLVEGDDDKLEWDAIPGVPQNGSESLH